MAELISARTWPAALGAAGVRARHVVLVTLPGGRTWPGGAGQHSLATRAARLSHRPAAGSLAARGVAAAASRPERRRAACFGRRWRTVGPPVRPAGCG